MEVMVSGCNKELLGKLSKFKIRAQSSKCAISLNTYVEEGVLKRVCVCVLEGVSNTIGGIKPYQREETF